MSPLAEASYEFKDRSTDPPIAIKSYYCSFIFLVPSHPLEMLKHDLSASSAINLESGICSIQGQTMYRS